MLCRRCNLQLCRCRVASTQLAKLHRGAWFERRGAADLYEHGYIRLMLMAASVELERQRTGFAV